VTLVKVFAAAATAAQYALCVLYYDTMQKPMSCAC
jgi:hypothetical protein